MKTILSILFVAWLAVFKESGEAPLNLVGAWQRDVDGNRITMICSDKFFAAGVYSLNEKQFVGTCGGSWRVEGSTFIEVHEFNTLISDNIGKELRSQVEIKNGELIFTVNGKKEAWTRIDDGTPGKLAGAWLITSRKVGDGMQAITPGARKTMKILSGKQFQWIAYNSETKEFFGTGGGTYTTENGKYTENIQFFSRDNSRVGASLQFDFSMEDANWRHKGFSSKGDPIDEVWTKRETLGL